ncbi:MAG: DEAD/DEAH box helicase family protein [Pirellulaceae bacterium]
MQPRKGGRTDGTAETNTKRKDIRAAADSGLRDGGHRQVDAGGRRTEADLRAERDDNPVVVIPTAGGKTPILATICRDAIQRWDGRVLVVSHVKELLAQAVEKLKHVAPDLPVGVYSAGLKPMARMPATSAATRNRRSC